MKRLPKETITGEKKPIHSIYELLGMNVNPYKQRTIEEYRAYLTSLTLSDLQDHAVNEAGTIPYETREKLTQHLERQFLTVQGQIKATSVQSEDSEAQLEKSRKKSHLTKAEQKQVSDLLSRGK